MADGAQLCAGSLGNLVRRMHDHDRQADRVGQAPQLVQLAIREIRQRAAHEGQGKALPTEAGKGILCALYSLRVVIEVGQDGDGTVALDRTLLDHQGLATTFGDTLHAATVSSTHGLMTFVVIS